MQTTLGNFWFKHHKLLSLCGDVGVYACVYAAYAFLWYIYTGNRKA